MAASCAGFSERRCALRAGCSGSGIEHQDEGQVGRIDQEALAGLGAKPREKLRPRARHIGGDAVENRLDQRQRNGAQQQRPNVLQQRAQRRGGGLGMQRESAWTKARADAAGWI